MGVTRVRELVGCVVAALALTVLPVGTAAAAEPPAEPGPWSTQPEAAPTTALAPTAQPRIIGGSRANITEYPWTVYLRTPSGFQYCGGTLVGESSVVTAAHCTATSAPGEVFVVAGREDKMSDGGVVAAVSRIWVHPSYDRVHFRNDVSVLTLDRALPFATLPLATPADGNLYTPGAAADILGWGTTETGGASRYLLRATVPVGNDGYCGQAYGQHYDPGAMVCAGYPEGGVDTCQGDSGGPLVVGGRLIGITSFGIGCAEPGYPGVYTRVATYSDVIAAQLPR